MAMMRTRSQLSISAPPPSPIPTAAGSRSAANEILAEFIEKSLHVPDLTLPDPHFQATATRHPIPAQIDLRLLASRRGDSVDQLLRSAREFGAFRIGCHGISSEELRSLVREAGRIFGLLEEKDTGFRRNFGGNRDEIVWARSWKDRMQWAREYIGAERYRSFSQEMENVTLKLDAIAEKLGQVIVDNAGKQSGKRVQKGESVLSVYRYNHDNVVEQSPPLPKEENSESRDYTFSLHLPAKNCEFRIQSARGPLSFHADPDAVVVTFGQQLEAWSLGDFRCVSGEILYQPDIHGSRASFSIELKYSSHLTHRYNRSNYSKLITMTDQILIAIILSFIYYILVSIFS